MKKWQIILLALFLSGIAAAVVLYIYVYNKPHPDYETAKPEFVISAEDLYFSFIKDKSAADKKFGGKIVAIDGKVTEVEQFSDMVIVSFVFREGIFGGEGVRCTMLKGHHARALDLLPGEKITIKGLCVGFTDPDVILDHCSFH